MLDINTFHVLIHDGIDKSVLGHYQAEQTQEPGIFEAPLYKYLWSSSLLLTRGHGPGKQ